MTYLNNETRDTPAPCVRSVIPALIGTGPKIGVLVAVPPHAGMGLRPRMRGVRGREGDANLLVRWVNDLAHKRPRKSGLTYINTKLSQVLEPLPRLCLSYLLDQVVLHLSIPLDRSLLCPPFPNRF